jgi:hypothetical protein
MKTLEKDSIRARIDAICASAEAEMVDFTTDEQAAEIYMRHGVDESTSILLARMKREDIEHDGQVPE